MIIEYIESHYINKNHKIEIEDTKNVFLKGKSSYDEIDTYFGIWTNEKYLIIASINDRIIRYSYSLNKNSDTECDINNFLKCNSDIKKISREEFKMELDKIISKFEMK